MLTLLLLTMAQLVLNSLLAVRLKSRRLMVVRPIRSSSIALRMKYVDVVLRIALSVTMQGHRSVRRSCQFYELCALGIGKVNRSNNIRILLSVASKRSKCVPMLLWIELVLLTTLGFFAFFTCVIS